MSVAQDYNQHFQTYGGEPSMAFPHRRSSSILATGYNNSGYQCNPAAVTMSMQGSQSFNGNNGSSCGVNSTQWQPQLASTSPPSIWSQQYNCCGQWSMTTHSRQPSMSGYHSSIPNQHSYTNMSAVPVQLVQPYQPPMVNYSLQPVVLVPHPHMQQAPMVTQQAPMVQQPPQQQQPPQHLLQAPRMMPHYIQPVIPSQVPLYHRAAAVPFQSNDTKPSTTQATEYDIHTFAKFVYSVCIGISADVLSLEDTQKFESFIETMLYATRLQISTLFMSLVFLNRTNKLCSESFRNLPLRNRFVCALVLANKMHDDNTFTNASWSVVSEIPTKDITALEAQCLKCFGWDLSMGESGMSEYQYWQNCWTEFLQKVQNPSPIASPTFNGWGVQLAHPTFTVAAAC